MKIQPALHATQTSTAIHRWDLDLMTARAHMKVPHGIILLFLEDDWQPHIQKYFEGRSTSCTMNSSVERPGELQRARICTWGQRSWTVLKDTVRRNDPSVQIVKSNHGRGLKL